MTKETDLTKHSIRELMQLLEAEDAYFRSPDIDLDEALKRHAHAEELSTVLREKLSAVQTSVEQLSVEE